MNKWSQVSKRNLISFMLIFTRLKSKLITPLRLTAKASQLLKSTLKKQRSFQVSQEIRSMRSRTTLLKREKKHGIMSKLKVLPILSMQKNKEQLRMVPVQEFVLLQELPLVECLAQPATQLLQLFLRITLLTSERKTSN